MRLAIQPKERVQFHYHAQNKQMNPKQRQQWIYDELVKVPTLSYSVMFGNYSVMFGLSDKTFDKDWKKANESLKQYQETINKAKVKASINEEVKSLKKAILSKHEALEILTEIAIGKPKKIEGQIVMPSPNERKGAIETMAKLEGWNATVKTDITTQGEKIRTTIKWGDNEIEI